VDATPDEEPQFCAEPTGTPSIPQVHVDPVSTPSVPQVHVDSVDTPPVPQAAEEARDEIAGTFKMVPEDTDTEAFRQRVMTRAYYLSLSGLADEGRNYFDALQAELALAKAQSSSS